MAVRQDPVTINMSGISVSGVGGLGLVAVAAIMTWVFPQAWWLFVFGATGGSVLGVAIVAYRRRHPASGPSGDDPHILFRAPASVSQPPPRSAPQGGLRLASSIQR
jgi:hypothetical protein